MLKSELQSHRVAGAFISDIALFPAIWGFNIAVYDKRTYLHDGKWIDEGEFIYPSVYPLIHPDIHSCSLNP